jgi:oligopeptidase A
LHKSDVRRTASAFASVRSSAFPTLQAWDLGYASEKAPGETLQPSLIEEVKQYFPEPKVLEGMFKRGGDACTRLKLQAKTPRRDLGFRRCGFSASAMPTGELVGQFYLDLYARETKRGGAWMDEALTRRQEGAAGVQPPVAYLVCNFPSPVGGKPGDLFSA